MRKTIIAAMASLSLLVGCDVTTFLAQVQSTAASACMFVPTIETILAVAQALGFTPATEVGTAVNTVANAICSKVPPPTSARFRALPPKGVGPARAIGSVNGIVIRGWRV